MSYLTPKDDAKAQEEEYRRILRELERENTPSLEKLLEELGQHG